MAQAVEGKKERFNLEWTKKVPVSQLRIHKIPFNYLSKLLIEI